MYNKKKKYPLLTMGSCCTKVVLKNDLEKVKKFVPQMTEIMMMNFGIFSQT